MNGGETLYLDASALVKRYVQEPGSEEVIAFLDQAQRWATAAITKVEVAAALAKAVRMNMLSPDEGETAWQAFLADWPFLDEISVTSPLLGTAASLAWEHHLRGYDATHLAAALLLHQFLQTPVYMVSYDRALREAAQKEGLLLFPAEA